MIRKKNNLNSNISAVILAAGFGMRIENNIPKALLKIKNNKTILDYQLEALSGYIPSDNIIVVVGYKKELVMEQHPELTFVYNEAYNRTNTGKSLLKAVVKIRDRHILWLNGDVIFDKKVLLRIIKNALNTNKSCVLVDNKKCGEEEVKYSIDGHGNINYISKVIIDPMGEALGINMCIKKDIPSLVKHLSSIDARDYFEKAIENMIRNNRAEFIPVNTGKLFCQEIDFPEDLKNVRNYLRTQIKVTSKHSK